MYYLTLLGSPQLTKAQTVSVWETRKTFALAITLMLAPRWHTRTELAERFWPDVEEERGRGSLRRTLLALRQGVQETPTAHAVQAERQRIRWAAPLTIDVQLLERAAQSHPPQDEAAMPRYLATQRQALLSYQGEFLGDFTLPDAPDFMEWRNAQRVNWREELATIATRLITAHMARGEATIALAAARHWRRQAPLHEPAMEALMTTLLATGQADEALVLFGRFHRLIAVELELQPSSTLLALARQAQKASKSYGQSTAPASLLRFVGHNRPFQSLVAAYHATRYQPGMALISGEIGAGKTRLLTEFARWVQAQGGEVWQGHSFAQGKHLPLQPIAAMLRRRLARVRALDDHLSDAWLTELTRIVPEVRERYPDLAPPTADHCAPTRLYEAIIQTLLIFARRTPIVVLLDDLQWADEGTLDLCHYLVERGRQERIECLIVATMRPVDMESQAHRQPPIHALKQIAGATNITLPPLTLEACGALLSPQMPPLAVQRVARWLFAETEGNPGYIKHLVQALLHSGLAQWTPTGHLLVDQQPALTPMLPDDLRQMIEAQLQQLTPFTRQIVGAGAIIGTGFTPTTLHRLIGHSEAVIQAALDEAVRQHILCEQAEGYLFTHIKMREVASATLGTYMYAHLLRNISTSMLAELSDNAALPMMKSQTCNLHNMIKRQM